MNKFKSVVLLGLLCVGGQVGFHSEMYAAAAPVQDATIENLHQEFNSLMQLTGKIADTPNGSETFGVAKKQFSSLKADLNTVKKRIDTINDIKDPKKREKEINVIKGNLAKIRKDLPTLETVDKELGIWDDDHEATSAQIQQQKQQALEALKTKK